MAVLVAVVACLAADRNGGFTSNAAGVDLLAV